MGAYCSQEAIATSKDLLRASEEIWLKDYQKLVKHSGCVVQAERYNIPFLYSVELHCWEILCGSVQLNHFHPSDLKLHLSWTLSGVSHLRTLQMASALPSHHKSSLGYAFLRVSPKSLPCHFLYHYHTSYLTLLSLPDYRLWGLLWRSE